MIRIGIVDVHAILRAGLSQFMSDELDFRVTANGHEPLDKVRADGVDGLVLDLSIPERSGFPDLHDATTLLGPGVGGYLNKECDS